MALNNLRLPNGFIREIMQKWEQLHDTAKPVTFSYRLNVVHCRYLRGSLGFYTELNPQRTKLRRAPQALQALSDAFDDSKFNFKQIKSAELLFVLQYGEQQISFIINKNPLTRYHMVICPDVHQGLAQQLNMPSLKFCVNFLRVLSTEHGYLRIGFNSPGASSSVNHLHLHILAIERELYIDRAALKILASDGETCVYCLDDSMPTQAICWLIKPNETDHQVTSKLKSVMKFVNWLIENNLPYNLFLTSTRVNDPIGNGYKLFIFAREHFTMQKATAPDSINIGFCELAGFVPVGDTKTFEELEESTIIERIQAETGNVYSRIYSYFTEH